VSGRAGLFGSDQPRSLTLAIYRHTVILIVAAAVLVALGYAVPLNEQPIVWLAAAAILGLLAGIISGWYGLIFLLSGLGMGIVLNLAIHHPSSGQAADQLDAVGQWHVALLAIAAVAFVVARLATGQLLRRRN
jgi:hypothetical protein